MSEHLKLVKNVPGKGNSKGKALSRSMLRVFEKQQEASVAGV